MIQIFNNGRFCFNVACNFLSAVPDSEIWITRIGLFREYGEWFYPHIDMFAGGPVVNTVPPKVIGGSMVYYKDREIVPNWDNPVPEEMIAKLSQVPYFKRAYDENGYDIEQFNEIPSLLENEVDFVGAAKEMVEYVGGFL